MLNKNKEKLKKIIQEEILNEHWDVAYRSKVTTKAEGNVEALAEFLKSNKISDAAADYEDELSTVYVPEKEVDKAHALIMQLAKICQKYPILKNHFFYK